MTNTNTLPFLDRLLSWSLGRTIPPPFRYGIATLTIVGVGLFRVLLVASIVPWLLFIPPILAIGLLLGRGPGIYAAVLAGIVAGLSIGHAGEPLWLSNAQWIGSVLFVLVASGIAVLAAELRAVFARARTLARQRDAAEERQQLLNNELSHRLKNVLAVVQSVASQTLRQADDLPSANDALSARLAALAQATDVLTATSWAAADLHTVSIKALAPHGTIGERIRVTGPTITLLPQVTMAFALALHELATNAAKYGALSNTDGHVDLTWRILPGEGEEPRFSLTWEEVGGPAVSPPARQGFGSKMIERSLRSYFRGPARLDYRPDGLVFTLDAPLGEAGKVGEQA